MSKPLVRQSLIPAVGRGRRRLYSLGDAANDRPLRDQVLNVRTLNRILEYTGVPSTTLTVGHILDLTVSDFVRMKYFGDKGMGQVLVLASLTRGCSRPAGHEGPCAARPTVHTSAERRE